MKRNNNTNSQIKNKNSTNTQFQALANAFADFQKKGTNTKIALNQNLIRNDQFIVTRTFSYNIGELPQLSKEHKMWQKIINAVPHLIQKQKVIYLISGKMHPLSAKIADMLYKNESAEKAIPLKTMKDFSFIKNKNQNAVIFQEYSFNYSRFYIEALKHFEKQGGKISFENFSHEQEFLAKPAVLLPVKTYPQFALVVKENSSFIRFNERGNKVLVTEAGRNLPTLSHNELLKMSAKYISFEIKNIEETEISEPPSVNSIYKIILQIEGRMDCSFECKRLDDYYEICLEKYDLAKQTGISFEAFKMFFHRYGTAIDEITETTYQILEETRDPKKIWETAEKEYQAKYEWEQLLK